ncbi:hypothetical protein Bca4012_026188 [Brassica carinata]
MSQNKYLENPKMCLLTSINTSLYNHSSIINILYVYIHGSLTFWFMLLFVKETLRGE